MKKLITDKTLAAFEKWFYDNHGKCSKKYEELLSWQKSEIMDWIFNACETIQHAFLIDFFDSVGIYISISADKDIYELNDIVYFISFVEDDASNQYETRQEATLAAIEQANIIFNNR